MRPQRKDDPGGPGRDRPKKRMFAAGRIPAKVIPIRQRRRWRLPRRPVPPTTPSGALRMAA